MTGSRRGKIMSNHTPPSNLRIGAHTMEILFPYAFLERGDLAGQYDHNAKKIRICGTDAGGCPIHATAIASTFLHEIIHALDKNSGHRIFDDHEPALNALSEGLLQVLMDNPRLMEYLDSICKEFR